MKTLLSGSLSQVITDIVKGGGCPEIKAPNKRYSVLRYFSRMKDDDYAITGPVGDGGYINDSGYSPSGIVFFYNKVGLNLNDNIPHGSSVFPGSNNALNICNRREILSATEDNYLNDELSPSIHNIEGENDVIEKDIDGYYNYNLLKKNHTMTITPAGGSPVSKTADLMEYVYLHAFIPPCRSGEIYLEIEDFDIVGSVTNDYLIYCFMWETQREKSNIRSVLENTEGFFSDNDDFLLTNNNNTVCKVFKASQVKGTGDNKKLVIWLNRNKTRSESFAVNVLIGFKPQDMRRDEQQPCPNSTDTLPVIRYDDCDDTIFKFKKATIKTKRYSTTINNQPITPNFGYKGLLENVYADDTDYIVITTHALNSSGEAVPINTQTGIVEFGPPEGGSSPISAPFYWQDNVLYYYAGGGFGDTDYLMQRSFNGAIDRFSLLRFLRTTETLDPSQSYILKLPPLTNMSAWNIDIKGGSYNINIPPPTDFYFDIFGTHATDYVIKIYCGEYPEQAPGQYPRFRTFLNSLVLLHTFNLTDIIETLVEANSGDPLSIGTAIDGVDPVIGTPYYGFEEIFTKKNKYKYITFSGASVEGITFKNFYISLERSSQSIKTISYAPVGDGDPFPFTFYFPSGVTPYLENPIERCACAAISEYTRTRYDGGLNSVYCKNYDAMIFKAPQIINKNETPEPENYTSS